MQINHQPAKRQQSQAPRYEYNSIQGLTNVNRDNLAEKAFNPVVLINNTGERIASENQNVGYVDS